MTFDRQVYFDTVREPLFGGALDQGQVDGQEYILGMWEDHPNARKLDLHWLAYCLATAFHETAATMLPIEEYGKGAGHPYGEQDPETKQTYYGRGFVQLTWRENYARASDELELEGPDDLEWHAERALDPEIAARTMFHGMHQGWFTGKKLGDFFNNTVIDPVGARAIVNNDVEKNGDLIAGYFWDFLEAIDMASLTPPRLENGK